MHANIDYHNNLNRQDKWIAKSLITQPLHQVHAGNLKGMVLPVAAVSCELPPFT
jgi:hypothetical protein